MKKIEKVKGDLQLIEKNKKMLQIKHPVNNKKPKKSYFFKWYELIKANFFHLLLVGAVVGAGMVIKNSIKVLERTDIEVNETKTNDQFKKASLAKKPMTLKLLQSMQWERKQIDAVQYKVGGSFMRKVSSDKVPRLITNSPVKDWDCFNWDLLHIAKENPELLLNYTFYKLGDPVFLIGVERDKGGMIGSPKDYSVMYINVRLLNFLQDTLDSNATMYYRGDVERWRTELNSSIAEWEQLSIREKELDDLPSSAVLHISHPSMIFQTHYRTRHLVVNQVQGYKRFIIFVPQKLHEHLYPNIHRSFSFSQVHLEQDRNSTVFREANEHLALYDITIGPGDTLYIPPYWTFREESITLSLSIYIESPSSTQAAFSEAFSHQIPLGEFQSELSLRCLGVTLLLREIIAKAASTGCLTAEMTLPQFVSKILESRYKPYLASDVGSLLPTKFDLDKCRSDVANSTVQELVYNNTGKWELAANKVTRSICNVATDSAIIERTLMDYTEQLVRWAVSPRLTAAYLMKCFVEL